MKKFFILFLLAAMLPMAVFAQNAPAIGELEAALTASDANAAQNARMKLERIPGPEADQALLRALDKAQGNELAGIASALGNRNVTAAAEKLLPLVDSSNEIVAISAVTALGKLGDAKAVPALRNAQKNAVLAPHAIEALLRIAEASIEKAPETARDIYGAFLADSKSETYWAGIRGFLRFDTARVFPILEKCITGEDDAAANRAVSLLFDVNDSAFLAKISDLCASLPEARQLCVMDMFASKYIFSAKADGKIVPGVKKVLETAKDPAVLTAAVTALGQYGNASDLPVILKALEMNDAGVQRAAEAALVQLNVPNLPELLLGVLENSDSSVGLRISVIKMLTLRKAGDTAKIFRTLEKLNAESSDEGIRAAALQGMVAIAPTLEDPRATYFQLIRKAPNADVQKQILNAITNSWPTFEAIDLAVEIMRTMPEIRPNAGLAAVHMGNRLRNADVDQVVSVLKTVVREVQHDDVEKRANALLAELNKAAGFMHVWAFNGPYLKDGVGGQQLHDIEFGPEKDGKIVPDSVEWTPLTRGQDGWIWRLESGIQTLDNGTAYLRTFVYSPIDQEALFYGGVDDGMKIWLNGEFLLTKYTSAPPSLGQCECGAKLRKGWNEVVLKITDAGGGWDFGLRLCTQKHEAIDGLKFKREK